MPVYITKKQKPYVKQMTFLEFLYCDDFEPAPFKAFQTGTRTVVVDNIPNKHLKKLKLNELIFSLAEFNIRHRSLYSADRKSLYRSFSIPKKTGGFRRIDAPVEQLSDALRELKSIFETQFHALYHTSAFAYVKHRSTLECMKKHQQNKSRWFMKLDLTNFFGATTLEWTMNMLSMIFPFSEIVKDAKGKTELKKALDLAFLSGGLPQGTPISPMITNICMIPIDFTINKKIKNIVKSGKRKHEVYTRYADDFQISSRYGFDQKEVEKCVVDVLNSFGAPFHLNKKKTRYGSSSGRNWNLGLMLNKDNEITVGSKNKKQFKTALFNYAMDKKNGKKWEINDVQILDGKRNYYKMIEGETIDAIVDYVFQKTGIDVEKNIKSDLKTSKKHDTPQQPQTKDFDALSWFS